MTEFEDYLKARAEHIEKFAAAFVKQVGNERAAQYELVEQRDADGLCLRWFFRPKKDVTNIQLLIDQETDNQKLREEIVRLKRRIDHAKHALSAGAGIDMKARE